MSLLQAAILAVIQGLTEFLPISSSGHLALAPWLLGWPDQGLTFDIALHFGTLLAVLIYFFRDWLQLAAQAVGIPYAPDPVMARRPQLMWWLAAATVPVGIAGLLLKEYAETTLRNPWVIGGMFLSVGLLMWWAERRGTHTKQIDQMTFADAMVIGAAQALAVVPGTSRSGITLVAGLLRDVERHAAARFSFLLSMPAIAAAAAKAAFDLAQAGGVPDQMRLAFAVGVAASAITGVAVIAAFLRFLRSHTLMPFVYYRIISGIMVIALALLRDPVIGHG